MTDFFNDFDKVNEKENPQPEVKDSPTEKTEKDEKPEPEKVEGKEEAADFSKTLENLRNEIVSLKELLKNSSKGSDAINENKTESEEEKE